MNYDVFNGDADGICALIQLRLAEPIKSTLVTNSDVATSHSNQPSETHPSIQFNILTTSYNTLH